MKPNKIAFYLLPVIFIPIIAIFLWKAYLEYQPHGLSDIGQAQDYPYSRYSNGNGKVYYLKVGLGYFPVDQADGATFQALNTVNDRGAIGKDAKHVFYKTAIIPGLNPANVVYLGNNYFKAGRSVYYGNTVLNAADAASFKFIKGNYSRDNRQVFFKQKPVPGADLKTLDSVKNNQLPYEYVADQHRVYYNGEVIDGARAAKFTLLDVAEDQWHTQYAFDGENYFFEKHQILVEHDARKTHLKLITLDKGFGWHGLFYQDRGIYCYDTERNQIQLMGNRDNSAPITQVDRGIFADGKHVYFTFTKWNKAGGRMPHYTGHTTGICIAGDAAPRNFKAAGSYTTAKDRVEGIRYQSGTHAFFHPNNSLPGNYSAGLMKLNADGTTEQLPTGNAMSEYIKTDNGPSVFSLRFYKNLFKADSVYEDQ